MQEKAWLKAALLGRKAPELREPWLQELQEVGEISWPPPHHAVTNLHFRNLLDQRSMAVCFLDWSFLNLSFEALQRVSTCVVREKSRQ